MVMPATTSLLLPRSSEDGLAGLRSRYLRRTVRRLVEWPEPLPPHLARPMADVRSLVGRLLAESPAELYSALALPQVGAPLHAGALEVAIPALLLELSRRRRLGKEGVWWAPPVDRLVNAPLGLARDLDPPRAGMLFLDGELEVSPGETWVLSHAAEPAFHRLAEGGWLAEADTNPLAMVEAHPDKSGNALSLGSATAAAWGAALDRARGAIRAALPALADEHRRLLALVVPVGGPMEVSWSASYREAIGVVYLSLHPDPLKMAEALVHELQHNKLNLAWYTDPLLVDGGEATFVSPVRPDPRPLWGVLLAAHAFLPVVEMYRRLAVLDHPWSRSDTFRARWREVVEKNREALDVVVRHARPTPTGARLIEEMVERHAEQESELATPP